jgi:serine/threonine-protein kinase HipA
MNKEINIKNIFNSKTIPIINFTRKGFNKEINKIIGKLSISGVQKKISLKIDRKKLELVTAHTLGEYILKPQLEQWEQVPENEELCMSLADAFQIETAEHTLIPFKGGEIAYITKRFDRVKTGKVAVEDFCQILEYKKKDKYNGSIEKIGNAIKKYSAAPGLDNLLLFRQVLFNFLISNADGHLKNYSLMKKDNGYRLSPAYDLVNTKLLIPDDNEESALNINGKKRNLNFKDFLKLANNLNISEKALNQEIKRIITTKELFFELIDESYLKQSFKDLFKKTYKKNISIFI